MVPTNSLNTGLPQTRNLLKTSAICEVQENDTHLHINTHT